MIFYTNRHDILVSRSANTQPKLEIAYYVIEAYQKCTVSIYELPSNSRTSIAMLRHSLYEGHVDPLNPVSGEIVGTPRSLTNR